MKIQSNELQLSLDHPVLGPELARLLADEVYPEELVYKAYRVTLAHLSDPTKNIRNPRAFFRGVLRRLVLRPVPSGKKDGQDGRLRRLLKERLLINSVVEDMRRAGYTGVEIFSRIVRDYGEKIDPELLGQYRAMLLRPARRRLRAQPLAGGKVKAKKAS